MPNAADTLLAMQAGYLSLQLHSTTGQHINKQLFGISKNCKAVMLLTVPEPEYHVDKLIADAKDLKKFITTFVDKYLTNCALSLTQLRWTYDTLGKLTTDERKALMEDLAKKKLLQPIHTSSLKNAPSNLIAAIIISDKAQAIYRELKNFVYKTTNTDNN